MPQCAEQSGGSAEADGGSTAAAAPAAVSAVAAAAAVAAPDGDGGCCSSTDAATSAELLRRAVGCVDAGGYLRLGALFFSTSADGAIHRIVLADSLEDIPAVGSGQWRSLGHTDGEMFAARHCHRLRKPVRPQVSGFWIRFAALFNGPELRPLAERWDCRAGLRLLRVDDGRLIFEFGGIEFGLSPRAAPSAAAHVQLPEEVELADLPLLVPELAAEEQQDDDAAAGPDEADAAGAVGAAGSSFLVGDINTQQAIEAALHVRGTSFDELSRRMQPLSSVRARRDGPGGSGDSLRQRDEWFDYSVAGFLKRGCGLKAQLLADNALVLGLRPCSSSPATGQVGQLATPVPLAPSHQALVGPLLKATRLHRAAERRLGVWVHELRFRHLGGRFTLLHEHASGCQQSPFMDGTSSGQHFCLVNEGTGDRLGFEGLAPVMAYRYGFYQSGRYRLDPAAVGRVLGGSG